MKGRAAVPRRRSRRASAPNNAIPPSWRQTPAADNQPDCAKGPLLFERWTDWGEADHALDVHMDALRGWRLDLRATAARVCLDWCIAGLEDVSDRLRQLRAVVTDARASRRIGRSSLLVVYLGYAYVWTGDVLPDVQALVDELEGGPPASSVREIDDSSAYIALFLEPLHRKIQACRPELDPHSWLHEALAETARLQTAIVALDWGLRTEAASPSRRGAKSNRAA